MSKEVVIVQLGNLSNYCGTHFWNLEEELCHQSDQLAAPTSPSSGANTVASSSSSALTGAPFRHRHYAEVLRNVLFQESLGASGPGSFKYTPRLLACDLTNSLGKNSPYSWNMESVQTMLKQQSASTSSSELHLPTWGGSVNICIPEAFEGIDQYDVSKTSSASSSFSSTSSSTSSSSFSSQASSSSLSASRSALLLGTEKDYDDGSVKSWTDYIRPRVNLASKHIFEIPGVSLGVHPFDYYTQGLEIFRPGTSVYDEVVDRIRLLAEDCDNMQGIQVSFDVDSGWSGATQHILSSLQEDYNLPIFTVANTSFSTAIASIEVADARASFGNMWANQQASHVLHRRWVNSTLALARLAPLSSVYVPVSGQELHQGRLREPQRRFNQASSSSSASLLSELPSARMDKVNSLKSVEESRPSCQGQEVSFVNLKNALYLNAAELFHSSAIMATALHSCTLPFRMRTDTGGCHLQDYINVLVPMSAVNVTSLAIGLPAFPSALPHPARLPSFSSLSSTSSLSSSDTQPPYSLYNSRSLVSLSPIRSVVASRLVGSSDWEHLEDDTATQANAGLAGGDRLAPFEEREVDTLFSEWVVLRGPSLWGSCTVEAKDDRMGARGGSHAEAHVSYSSQTHLSALANTRNSASSSYSPSGASKWLSALASSLEESKPCSQRAVVGVSLPLSIHKTYPKIFLDPSSNSGHSRGGVETFRPDEVAVMTDLYACQSMYKDLDVMAARFALCRKHKPAVLQFEKDGMTYDDWEEVNQAVKILASDYRR